MPFYVVDFTKNSQFTGWQIILKNIELKNTEKVKNVSSGNGPFETKCLKKKRPQWDKKRKEKKNA